MWDGDYTEMDIEINGTKSRGSGEQKQQSQQQKQQQKQKAKSKQKERRRRGEPFFHLFQLLCLASGEYYSSCLSVHFNTTALKQLQVLVLL
jgi:hypothetical protein